MPTVRLPNGRELTGDFNLDDKVAVAKLAIDKGLAKPSDFPEKYRPSFELGTTLLNVPGSTWKEVKDLYSAVTHPMDTYKALEDLTSGIGAKYLPESWHEALKIRPEQAKVAEAVGQDIKNKYGTSLDDTLAYLQRNPAGVLADLSIPLTGGGTAVRGVAGLAKAARIPGAAAVGTLGKGLAQVGAGIDPLNIAGNALGAMTLTPLGRSKLPVNAYASSAGIPTKQAEFALSRNVLPNERGLKTLISERDPLREALQTRINNIQNTIPAVDLIEATKPVGQRAATNNLNMLDDIAEYQDALDTRRAALGIVEQPPIAPHLPPTYVGPDINAGTLQNYKTRTTNRILPPGEQTNAAAQQAFANRSVTDQVDLAIADRARKTLEGWDPEVGRINQRLAPYEAILPGFADAVERVRLKGGSLSPTEAIPIAVGSTGGTLGLGAAATTATASKAGPKAALARAAYRKGHRRGYGFAENKVLQAMAQSFARELEEQKRFSQ